MRVKAGHAGRSERTEGDVPSLSSPGAPSLLPCGNAHRSPRNRMPFPWLARCAIWSHIDERWAVGHTCRPVVDEARVVPRVGYQLRGCQGQQRDGSVSLLVLNRSRDPQSSGMR